MKHGKEALTALLQVTGADEHETPKGLDNEAPRRRTQRREGSFRTQLVEVVQQAGAQGRSTEHLRAQFPDAKPTTLTSTLTNLERNGLLKREAANLGLEDLLERLWTAATAVQVSQLTILIAVLITKFPQCVSAINAFKAAAATAKRIEKSPSLHGQGWWKKWKAAEKAMDDAYDALVACVAAVAAAPPAATPP